jgi:lipopolysaccharide transport system permease protein
VTAIFEPLQLIARHRALTWAVARRDLVSPYAGEMLGGVWAILHPMFLVALLTWVFNFLLGARFGGTRELPLDYTTYILAGLVPWQSFMLVLARSGTEVVGSASLVKQVVFPLEVLPLKTVVLALPPMAIGIPFLILYVLFTTGAIPPSYALLPAVVVLHLLWMLGVSFALSAIGVYFRDVKDVVTLFVTASIYLLPIIFTPGALPVGLRHVITLNPFSALIWCYQDVLYFGRIDHPWAWLFAAIFSVGSFFAGFAIFRHLKPFFGSAL